MNAYKKQPTNLKEAIDSYQECYQRLQNFRVKYKDILNKDLSVDISQEGHDMSKIGTIMIEEKELKKECRETFKFVQQFQKIEFADNQE